jgi:hypothetical protein
VPDAVDAVSAAAAASFSIASSHIHLQGLQDNLLRPTVPIVPGQRLKRPNVGVGGISFAISTAAGAGAAANGAGEGARPGSFTAALQQEHAGGGAGGYLLAGILKRRSLLTSKQGLKQGEVMYVWFCSIWCKHACTNLNWLPNLHLLAQVKCRVCSRNLASDTWLLPVTQDHGGKQRRGRRLQDAVSAARRAQTAPLATLLPAFARQLYSSKGAASLPTASRLCSNSCCEELKWPQLKSPMRLPGL